MFLCGRIIGVCEYECESVRVFQSFEQRKSSWQRTGDYIKIRIGRLTDYHRKFLPEYKFYGYLADQCVVLNVTIFGVTREGTQLLNVEEGKTVNIRHILQKCI